MNRNEILTELKTAAARGEALVAVGAATGLVAQEAERSGADLVTVYNSGWFRSHGHPSLAGLMPYGDANGIVVELGRLILPVVEAVPVVAGVCATDPFRDMSRFLNELAEMGFAGVQNFPTVGLIDGIFREALEATGIRFDEEIEMIVTARSLGLLTCAFVCDAGSAAAMAQVGADIIVPHLGVTRDGGDLLGAADRVQEMRDAAVAVEPNVLVLFHGGPASGPEEVDYILNNTQGVAGFVAASSVERFPVQRAVRLAVSSLRSLSIKVDDNGQTAREPSRYVDVSNLVEYLKLKDLVSPNADVAVEDLGGGISNAVLLYTANGERAVLKQGRPRIRVQQEWLCDVRRVLVERDAMQVIQPMLAQGTVPLVRFSDEENYLFVMEAAPPDARLWKPLLLAGEVDLTVVGAAASTLATIHRRSAGDRELRRQFGTSMLSQLRIDPYYMATASLHPVVKSEFERAVRHLVGIRETLVHGDFVPKNILVTTTGDLVLLDYEICHFGNPAYDVATFVNHMLLKALAFPENSGMLVTGVHEFLRTYFIEAGNTAPADDETLLHLGCLMLARIDGKSPVDYITTEEVRQSVTGLAYSILTGSFSRVAQVADQLEADQTSD